MGETIAERGIRARELTSGIQGTTAEMLAEVRSGHYGNDVSTPDKPDLQQFTPEQIEEYCKKVDNMGLYAYRKGNCLWEAVQIIRQLQTHVRAVSHIAEALAEDLPDDKRITLNRFRVQELVDILQLREAAIGAREEV